MELLDIIESIETKYSLSLDAFLDLYKRKLSKEDIAERLDIEVATVEIIGKELDVVWKKGERARWYVTFLIAKNAEEENKEEITEKATEESDYLSKKLVNAERQLAKLRLETNQLRSAARRRYLQDDLETKVEQIITKALPFKSKLKPTFSIAPNIEVSNVGLVAVIGDWHIGDTADADVPDNTFNYEVAEKRIHKFTESVLTNPQQSSNLTLVNLNDNFKGIIHGGLYTSEVSFITSLQKYLALYTDMLAVFAEIYDTVTVYSTGDNHSRVHENTVTTNKHLDYSRLMDTITSTLIQAKGLSNVTIRTTDTGYHLININGANILLFHGDTIRSYKPTITSARSKLQDTCNQVFKESYRHAISGHQHEMQLGTNQYDGINLVNGSLVGNTGYGFNNGMSAIKPEQTILYIGEDGNIEQIKPIFFD